MGLIYVTNAKTGYDREVPMNAKSHEVLSELRQANGEHEFVFTNPNTGLNLVDLKHGFRSACDEDGIQDFRFHDLRHTTGTWLADAGTDAFAIAGGFRAPRPADDEVVHPCDGTEKAACGR